ncbi:MAG: tRNA pseudouridine(55) synthase TruB [Clostridia bacterium]|nr:tRNA pseudouridine(55) synthase TruB [Clostridia bacterium]
MQGIILLKKPKGITSFSAVSRVRRLCGIKRVGHTGTLDPLAEGVLPILVGRATALSSYVTDADKSYIARVRLGLTTDTEDITGEVLKELPVSVTEAELIAAANAFSGKIMQVPPMYSAISQNGVRLYKLAREGKTVEREAREIVIKKIEVSDFDGRDFTLSVCCSKGTYIRSLCRDIGEKLGCGATLTELLRTETAGFSIENAVALEDLSEENVCAFLKPADLAVAHLPFTSVTEKQAIRFSNGGELDLTRIKGSFSDRELVRVKFGEILLGLGIVMAERGILKVECVINDAKGSDCGA